MLGVGRFDRCELRGNHDRRIFDLRSSGILVGPNHPRGALHQHQCLVPVEFSDEHLHRFCHAHPTASRRVGAEDL